MYSVKLPKCLFSFVRRVRILSYLFYKKTSDTLVFYERWVKVAIFMGQISKFRCAIILGQMEYCGKNTFRLRIECCSESRI